MSDIKIIELELEKIRLDGGTQPRAEISTDVLKDYAELMREGIKFPPVDVFFDGCDYWLADGFHRYLACRSNEQTAIEANVRNGSQRDAILFSVAANATHGLPRNISDKRRAVLVLLYDEQWSQWSDREIARRSGVSHTTVIRHRTSLERRSSEKSESKPLNRTYKTKHGTVSRMKTGNIGKSKAVQQKVPVQKISAFAVRRAREAMPMTNLNMPHDPGDGARAIMSAMGREYALSLAENINIFLYKLDENQKEG